MAVTWKIVELERNTDNGVVTAHWTAFDSETIEGVEHKGSHYGSTVFAPDTEAEGYIEYVNLTEATVVAWVKAGVDGSIIEERIAGQIEESKAPAISTGVPW